MKFVLDINDKRLSFVSKNLTQNGYAVENFSKDDLSSISAEDVVVLSPAFKWNENLANDIPSEITIFAGNVFPQIKQIFDKKDIKYVNLMEDEDFVLENAKLTAEGTLANLIEHTQESMFDLKILVLGGGRVAKAVGYLFYKLGLDTTFTTRDNGELKNFSLHAKCTPWQSFKTKLKDYDVIINTVPAQLFESEDEGYFNTDQVVLELASVKCLDDTKFNKVKYILCPALPAKFTPKAAGDLILYRVYKFLKGEQ